MNVRGWTLAAAVVLAGGLIASLAGPPALAETDSGAAALQTRVAELEEVVQAQQQQIAEMAKALKQVEATTDGLVSGAKALGVAAQTSRESGFEWAGPNPKAKGALLDGLKKFASAVESTRPKSGPK